MKEEDIVENTIRVKVSSHKGKFRFTIPAKEIRRVNAKTNDYIKVNLKKENHTICYYVRIPSVPKSRTNLQVRRAIPKEFADRAQIKENDLINLQISLVENKRSNELIHNGMLDILAATPEKTKSGRLVMVDLFNKNRKEYCKIWYCSGQGGSFKPIELKRFVKVDRKLGEFFGLMQAESRKNGYKLDFTNNLISEHKLFIRVAERFNISKDLWNYVLFYNPKIPKEQVEKHAAMFKKELKITKRVSCVKNKTLSNIAFTTYINSNVLAEVMISILRALRSKIAELTKEKNILQNIKDFAIGFLCKDLLGDGTVTCNKANKKLSIIISENDAEAQKDIIQIFENLGIKAVAFRNKIILSSSLHTYLWLLENEAFAGHPNRSKLIKNILRKHQFKHFYSRFKDRNRYTKEEFAKKYNLPIGTASMYLYRNSARGFLTKNQNYFELTKKGIKLIKTLKNAEKELSLTNC